MAHPLLTIGQLLFAAIGAAVGVRLLRDCIAERTLGLPALTTGAIFIGGTGLLLVQIGSGIGEGAVGRTTAVTGEVSMRVGILLLTLFVWKTFRPTGWGGTLGAIACCLALLASLIWDLQLQGGWWPYDRTLPSAHASQLAIALPFAWSSSESWWIWRKQKRQLALGLGDPILCNRFALWTIATGAFVGICLLAIAAGCAIDDRAAVLADAAQEGRGVLYLVVTTSIWLGIFTPGWFRARLERAA